MKLSINLLPKEFTEQDIKRAKFYKIQTIGVGVILFMFFLSSVTVVLRVLQNQNISKIQKKLTESEQKISGFKKTQASLFILKSRVSAIDNFLDVSSNQTQIYNIITKLVPVSVTVNSISVDRKGEVLLVATAPDPSAMDSFISNLSSKEKNEGRITQVGLDSFNRGKDGIYRINISIKTKFI